MAVRIESFAGPESIEAMCKLCVALRERGIGSEHTGDVNWAAYMHTEMNPARDTALLREGGSLVAWATATKHGLSFAIAHDARTDAVMDAVLGWYREHCERHGRRSEPLETSCFESDSEVRALLQARGFEPQSEHVLYANERSLSDPWPVISLPEGAVVRSPLGDEELDRRAHLHAAVWHPSKVTPAGYRLTRAAPNYHPELDVVAVLSDRSFAAYCLGWLEPATRTCELEPVGTHPDHRRKHLASACIVEALRRARALGAERAIVFSTEEGLPFYRTLGFEPFDRVLAMRR